MKNIVLIGMMGTYKTTAGKIVAKELKKKFLDTDKILASRFNMSINRYFEKYGEQSFREQEHMLCLELGDETDTVISTGGGVVKNYDNILAFKKNGIIICLSASPYQIYSRIKNSKTRPLLKSPNPLKKIEEILAERDPLYKKAADVIIHNDYMSGRQTAYAILDYIKTIKTD